MKGRLLLVGTILLTSTIAACSSPAPIPPATPTPTLVPDKGRVIGILQVRSSDGNPQPVKDASLYLAATVRDANGQDIFAGVDLVNSPRAISDDHGRFAFYNVDPGNYGLVYDLVFRDFLLTKPGSEDSVIFTVTAGKETDLGTLLYDSLPTLETPNSPAYPYP